MKRNLFVVLFVFGLVGGATAAPITITETFTGSGALGGTPYVGALVTLTFVGDTSNLLGLTLAGLGDVAVSGLGGTALTGDIRTVVNQGLSRGGISDFTAGRAILFTDNAAFAAYNLLSSLGPLSGPAAFNPGFVFPTILAGGFKIDSIAGDVTYTARVAVPEPASLSLLGAGLLGLMIRARRRA